MDSEESTINQWESFLSDRGLSSNLIDEYLIYIEKLDSNRVPVIFELEHLSILIGIDFTSLRQMISAPEYFYRDFSIPKRKGGHRNISAPYPALLMCQDWIYKNILIKRDPHHLAQGYVRGKSIITNASPHLDTKALLKMDLKDFFPSIPINWVLQFFHDLGYAKNVSFYLASLCCVNEQLPQGAATSPYLSNLLLISLDNRIDKLTKAYSIKYTRYADDLTFSGHYIPHEFSNIICEIVQDFGLKVNLDKTRLHLSKGQRIVTGISVAGKKPALPRIKKRLLRKQMHFIKKFGLLSHMSKLKIKDANYLSSLEGHLGFWLQVEPDNEFAINSIIHLRSLKNNET